MMQGENNDTKQQCSKIETKIYSILKDDLSDIVPIQSILQQFRINSPELQKSCFELIVKKR